MKQTHEDSGNAAVSPKFINLAKKVLDKSPVICDIGSRDALEGIYLLRQLRGQTLHIFEPNPTAADLCRGNLGMIGGDKTKIIFNEVAVTGETGRLPFYPVNTALSDNKDIGFSSLFQINPNYTKRRSRVVQDEVVVNSTTLDEYFADKQQPDLLWIDVEGAELQVFQGAANVLGGVKLIHVEVSFRPMQIGKPLFWEIEKYLSRYDFAFYGFMEVSAFIGLLYRYRLLPNLPWRMNAVFYRQQRKAV